MSSLLTDIWDPSSNSTWSHKQICRVTAAYLQRQGNNVDSWQEVYQVHRDDMWRHKFGPVYQPVCPSNLNGITFGGRSEPDAVSVLKVKNKQKKNLVTYLLSLSARPDKMCKWKCVSENLIDLNVLWEEIVAVGAVVKDDLVEGGGTEFLYLAVVITAIFVFTDHPLTNCQIPHRSLVPLEERTGALVWLC